MMCFRAKNWAMNEPTQTMMSAAHKMSTPNFWNLGSLPPLMMGVKNKPAAKNAVAIQNSAD